jgi:hypothetical protein
MGKGEDGDARGADTPRSLSVVMTVRHTTGMQGLQVEAHSRQFKSRGNE